MQDSGLDEGQRSQLFLLMESLSRIEKPAEFLDWTRTELQQCLPHDIMISGIGRGSEKCVYISKFMHHNYPTQLLAQEQAANGRIQMSPVMEDWWREERPQYLELDHSNTAENGRWKQLFEKFGMHNVVAHGVKDFQGETTSYFSFACLPKAGHQQYLQVLRLLVPHMHVVFKNFAALLPDFAPVEFFPDPSVTSREIQVLSWIQKGKTNWEIAQILELSDSTIKTYVSRIIDKLGANNRTHAVAKAVEAGLLSESK